ncbi:MAG: aryl-sulfate sulfotransferase [Cyanobacteria bacterium HKST-UBA03]|nr:aryl-sulfate sulfotransferase [Cyanobacteria bacterium HKST-UBA03]
MGKRFNWTTGAKGLWVVALLLVVYSGGLFTAVFDGWPYKKAEALVTYIRAVLERDALDHDYLAFRYYPARTLEKGVTVNKPAQRYEGLTLYAVADRMEARLVDGQGKLVRRWRFTMWDLGESQTPNPLFLRRVRLMQNGDLVALFRPMLAGRQPSGMMRADATGKVQWVFKGHPAHHDFDVLSNGQVAVLTQQFAPQHPTAPELDGPLIIEELTLVDEAGQLVKTVSIIDAFLHSPFKDRLLKLKEGHRADGDLLHINSVHMLSAAEAAQIPKAKAGDALLGSLNLNGMVLLDMASQRIAGVFQKDFNGIHGPVIQPDGSIVFLENFGGGAHPDYRSALTRYNPATGQADRFYIGTKDRPFFTDQRGMVVLLPNGNILAYESNAGCIIEVTPAGELVWQYYNPDRIQDMIGVVFGGGRYPTRLETPVTLN